MKFVNKNNMTNVKLVMQNGEQVGTLEKFKGGWTFTASVEEFDWCNDWNVENLKEARELLDVQAR